MPAAPESTDLESGTCDYDPEPTAVAVDTVPIVVSFTTDDYFVLYASFDVDGATWEMPVAVVLGEAGTTTLAENVEALAPGRYRVEKYLIADPADVDGDCTDDITELANVATMSPVNAAAAVDPVDGTVSVQDLDAFLALSHTHSSATHKRAGSSIVKFLVTNLGTDRPGLYFNNFNTSNYDLALFDSLGGAGSIDRFGVVTYDPELAAPDGSAGAYYADFGLGILPSFSEVERLYTLLAANPGSFNCPLPTGEGQSGDVLCGSQGCRWPEFHPHPSPPLKALARTWHKWTTISTSITRPTCFRT